MGNAVVVIVLLIIGAFWFKGREKTKAEAWEGIVIAKEEKYLTNSDGDDTIWYELTVKLNDESIKHVEVKYKIYKQFDVKDKIDKVAGELHPKKP